MHGPCVEVTSFPSPSILIIYDIPLTRSPAACSTHCFSIPLAKDPHRAKRETSRREWFVIFLIITRFL